MEENEKKQDCRNQQGQYIEPFGNIYESKSRPGRKYYYNIETNEPEWLPCDTQVEKTQSDKNLVQNQKIINKTQGAEAKGNMSRKVNNESDGSNTYYKQVINNQVLNQNCHIPVSENEQPFIFPNTIPVNIPAHSTVNPNIWAVPPTVPATQFIVAPAISPFMNQQQMLQYQSQLLIPVNLSQNILTTAVGELTNSSKMVNRQSQTFNTSSYIVRHDVNRRHDMHRKFNHKRKPDLRNILSAKESYVYSDNKYSNNKNKRTVSCIQNVSDNATTYQNYEEKNNYLEKSQRLDLTVIRDLAAQNVHMDQWYIVVDRIVIQENFNFLNNLIDSDNRCRIMVPESVLTELCTLMADHRAVKLRRIYRFISEEIESGRGWITDNLVNTEHNLSILEVCLKLSSERYHVVLLANSEECLKLKNTTEIPILTIQDFKYLLTKNRSVHSPPKRNCLGERVVSFYNNDKRNSIEAESKCSDEQGLIKNQHSCLSKPANIYMQTRIAKKNVESQNALDIAKAPEDVHSVLDYQKSVNDEVNSNAEGPSVLNNTNTPVKYNRRVIKLKHNEGNEKQHTRKGWSSRKRAKDGKNTDLASVDNSIPTSTISISDRLIGIIGSKCTVNPENIMFDTSDSIKDDNSESCSLLEKKKDIVVVNTSSLMSAVVNSEIGSNSRHQEISKCKLDQPNIKVMFEITDKNMEEHLTMRSDEWVSRFVQIMEEVLSQVLHQDPPFISEELPPPWILQEAAQCIIKKFSRCYYVVDAANNLSIIVHKISDNSGKILMNMEPTDFMKMYSFGVYLIEALMCELKNCEDLCNARELLKKLLHDIQNNDVDCSNYSFNGPVETPQIIEESTNIVEESLNRESVGKPATHSYEENLHERKLNVSAKDDDRETLFFSSLELQKSTCSSLNNSIETSGKGIATTIERDVGKDESQVKNSPKIVMHFSKCVEYENRLKNQKSKSMLWKTSYNSGIRNDEDSYVDDNLESDDDMYGDDDYESDDSLNVVEDNMKRFRYFIGLFLMEIKKTFTQVHTLCKNIVASEGKQSKYDKMEVYKKAEKAHFYIKKLSESLESIINRDVDNPDKDIQTLMKKAGVQMPSDQTLTTEYKIVISKCMDQAKAYISYLNLVTTLNRDIS